MVKAGKRKRAQGPVQGELFAPRGRRGGKRPGAGRPRKGERAGAPHKRRPVLAARYPVHVVIRAVADVGMLRRLDVYGAIRKATLRVDRRENFRIVHLSLQQTHIHLLVEASDKIALARGMQAFQISAAKQINRVFGRRILGTRRRGGCLRIGITQRSSRRRRRHVVRYRMCSIIGEGIAKIEMRNGVAGVSIGSRVQPRLRIGRRANENRGCCEGRRDWRRYM